MKMLQLLIPTLVVLGLFSPRYAKAEDKNSGEGLKIGAYLGPSVPSDNLKQVYELANFKDQSVAYDFATSLGFHVGARARYGWTEALSFCGGVQYTKFPDQNIVFTNGQGVRYEIQTTTNIIPVFAGLTFFPFQFVATPYFSGEVLYSYRSTSVSNGKSILQDVLSPGTELEPKQSRAGAALAFGIELHLAGLQPFVEAKYIMSNLVGKADGELDRSFLNISVGLIF
ncbi:MAG: outer membrane beta-barrel protein [Ignavibacteria bacterium]|nr:outer membrane beta-barrel protein [Ignavibacteria bacterium]